MKAPIVSIVMPAYNASLSIGKAVESVQSQTLLDWELIIVDDCSTDNTFEIASGYSKKDSRIITIRNMENAGVAKTRNTAMSIATGKYIAFLDSDDFWHNQKLEKQIAFMQTFDLGISYTYYQNFDNHYALGKIIKCPKQMTYKKILGNTSIGCLTVLVNREKTGLFTMPNLQHAEDMVTWYELLKRGFIARCLPEVLAFYRQGNKSLSENKKKSAFQQWKLYRSYFKFSLFRSSFYFFSYAFHAFAKHFL